MKKISILIPVWNQEELVLKAIDSIPIRPDIEVIICDDGSTDNTAESVEWYLAKNKDVLDWYFIRNFENKGLSYTKNRLLKMAKGKYFHFFDSDDYLITSEYEKVLDILDDQDVVCFNLEKNDGAVFEITQESCHYLCGQPARFIKKSFVNGLTFDETLKAAEDYKFNEELMARNPNIVYTGIVAYHYNFPREGSMYDLMLKGVL